MICDTDELISVNRDSSKTRLMGVNIHPSRKTEIERKEEIEEYITIKSKSEDADDCEICTNSEIKSHELLTKSSVDSIIEKEEQSCNIPECAEIHLNDLESVKTDQSPTTCKKHSKSDAFSGNNSNLNLIEGDLPEEMLIDFDIPSGPITPNVAAVILNVLKQGGRLSFKSVHKILRISYKFLSELPNTTKCEVGPFDRLTTVGDIHGQLPDLIHILEDSGFPSATNKYIFNGECIEY